MHIPYAHPSIGSVEVDLVVDAVANGWGIDRNKYLNMFQAEFASYVGSGFAIAASSCTGALHMGLAALGIGPGDEVILADTNWVATLAPIVHLGATPVLVDIRSDTWCVDPECVADAVTPRTRAVVATHLYGNVADVEDLQAICEAHGLRLIEDAAEGIGSRYGERHVGSIGDFGVFSFHGSKTITTGEGGMLVTCNPELHQRVETLSNHGRSHSETRMFWPERIGFKYKMSNVQAALGVAQIRRVSELVAEKQRFLDAYRSAFAESNMGVVSPVQAGRVNGGWMPTLELRTPTASGALTRLADASIDARPVFAPLSEIFPRYGSRMNHNARRFFQHALNLPAPLGGAGFGAVARVKSVLQGEGFFVNPSAR